jgi:hypothetical protein
MKLSIVTCVFVLWASLAIAQDKTADDFPKNEKVTKYIEMLAGTWKLQGIVDETKGNKNTANSPDSKSKDPKASPAGADQSNNAMQMLEFELDARYKVNNSTTAIDSGSYRVNEEHAILYMESDKDDITPTEWKMTIKENQLTLVGRGEKATSRYKYVYTKEQEK